MTLKTFVGTTAIACALVAPVSFVFADDTVAEPITETVITATTTGTVTAATEELATLKLREQDPETGSFMKFILRFKIRQLENQLNIKKALN